MRRFVRSLPALLIALGAAYDYATPLDFTGAPFLTAAPLVAAPLYSQRGTILTGVAAVAVLLVLRVAHGGLHKAEAVTELVTVVVVSVLAVLVNLLVRRGQERLASVREIAEAAQRAVLPEPAERIGGFQIVWGRLERALARERTRSEGIEAREGFTTVVLAELPHGDAIVRLVNRGHPAPLLLYADGTVRPLPATEPALPLGMGELGTWPDRADEAGFPGGATLLLYTDGLSEARDAGGRFYDPETGLAGRTEALCEPGALRGALSVEVRRHSGGGMADDMALIAVRRP
ncbi:hypothetical protein SCHAM137S_01470 [Streptomyces chartreusis]